MRTTCSRDKQAYFNSSFPALFQAVLCNAYLKLSFVSVQKTPRRSCPRGSSLRNRNEVIILCDVISSMHCMYCSVNNEQLQETMTSIYY